MSDSYFHSVHVLKNLCNGCVTCVKICPTEAIRVRGDKAEIVSDRCIDCGECIRRCPTHAMAATVDELSQLTNYKYNLALTVPSLYAQFPSSIRRESICQGIKDLGFDEIFDVSAASDYISKEIEEYLAAYKGGRKPLISSACPAVLRLIQIKFPELIKQVIPILAPGEAAAIYTKKMVCQRTHLSEEEVGVWFITPCPAKGTNIHQSVDVKHTELTGSISISSIYGKLLKIVDKTPGEEALPNNVVRGSSYGVGWGAAEGEIAAIGIKKGLPAHGISEVYEILEQISMNKLSEIDYVECYTCAGGCIGGTLAAENRFVSAKNLRERILNLRARENCSRQEALQKGMGYEDFPTSEKYVKILEPRPMMQLDEDISVAMEKLEQMEKVLNELPGLDCGACGAPTCQCLAEDIVQGRAHETACIFVLRSRVKQFARSMIELSKQIPLTGEQSGQSEKKGDSNEGK